MKTKYFSTLVDFPSILEAATGTFVDSFSFSLLESFRDCFGGGDSEGDLDWDDLSPELPDIECEEADGDRELDLDGRYSGLRERVRWRGLRRGENDFELQQTMDSSS